MTVFPPKKSFSESYLGLAPNPGIAQQCASSAKNILRIVARYPRNYLRAVKLLSVCLSNYIHSA